MGFFSSIGSFFNDISGATSAAQLNNKYQKEFAQNAHQWEVEDLKKAGLNPILSAGGSGATAGGSGGVQAASMGISDVANSAANLIKTDSDVSLQKSQADNLDADTINKGIEKGLIKPKAEAEIQERMTNSALNVSKQQEIKSKINLNSALEAKAKSDAEYNKRRASGKGVTISGNAQVNAPWGVKGTGGGSVRYDW